MEMRIELLYLFKLKDGDPLESYEVNHNFYRISCMDTSLVSCRPHAHYSPIVGPKDATKEEFNKLYGYKLG